MKVNSGNKFKYKVFLAFLSVLAFGLFLITETNIAYAGSVFALTKSQTNIKSNEATLRAYVIHEDTPPTYIWFEYGVNKSLGYSTSRILKNSKGTSNVSTKLSFLSPDTTYYFRVIAEVSSGKVYGDILEFRTKKGEGPGWVPTFQGTSGAVPSNMGGALIVVSTATLAPSNISNSDAQLNGFVNSSGFGTITHWFEWGPTANLGNTVTNVWAGKEPTLFTYALTGLRPNTTYYYRTVVQVPGGNTVAGNVQSFITIDASATGAPLDTMEPSSGGITSTKFQKETDVSEKSDSTTASVFFSSSTARIILWTIGFILITGVTFMSILLYRKSAAQPSLS